MIEILAFTILFLWCNSLSGDIVNLKKDNAALKKEIGALKQKVK